MGESAETSGTGADCTKLRCSRPIRAKYHHASKKRRRCFRSRELFETSPNYDDETEAIENALHALQALENCLRSNTKIADTLPSRLDCSQTTRMPCRWDKIAVS